MALSPVVTHTVESLQNPRSISSPLKTLVSSGQASSNGTPKPAPSAQALAALPATADLAEQMNDEEKRKYVKGNSVVYLVHAEEESEGHLLTYSCCRQEAR
jgi:cyclin-dependent kinase 7